tara:strand:- start:228 stop:755 length:528 start_codon:yes stop_codon:yes gene_type:complete
MPKKRNLEYLLKKVPSSKSNQTKIITFLFAVFLFSVLVYVGSVTYTGLAVVDTGGQIAAGNTQNIFIDDQFEVLNIDKSSNSVLDVNVDSTLSINLLAEIDDCSSWNKGDDRDDRALHVISGIKQGNFEIGNPSEHNINLYTTDTLCFVLINREFPNKGSVNIQYQETNEKWRIV